MTRGRPAKRVKKTRGRKKTIKSNKKITTEVLPIETSEPVVFPPTKFWKWGDPKTSEWGDKEEEKAPSYPKPNQALIELDTELDKFYNNNYKLHDPQVYNRLTTGNFKAAEVRHASDEYQALVDDLRDPKAKEGYARLKPLQKRNYITYLEKAIEECQLYLGNARKSSKVRKPRKKKIKSVDQLSAKVKFKTEDVSLKLVSVSPSLIVGCNAVWLFNTKTRRLTYLAAGGTGSLTIKGTTVNRFDPKISKQKKIRKPEVLQDLLSGTKAAMLKAFDKLKTTEYVARGRINGDTLILKVIK